MNKNASRRHASASIWISAFVSTFNRLSGARARRGEQTVPTRIQAATTPAKPTKAFRGRPAFVAAFALVFAVALFAPAARAQSVTFAGGQSVLGSGFSSPYGIAVDASGNVYIADTNNSEIKEILAVNGVIPASNPTVNILGSGFSYPGGVAVDASGNVYVADSSSSEIKEILAVNGSIPASNPTINILGSGFDFPYGVAVDASGNVYVADTSHLKIKEILAVNGSIPANNPTINVLGSGFSYPFGVAVDASGNVYVADTFNSEVKEILAVNGVIPSSNPTVNVLGSGFSSPQGVAVDASGNVYVADSNNSEVKEILAVNGSIPASNPTINVLGSGFSSPQGVAVDAKGDVFVADANNQIVELQLGAVNFGSANVCPGGQATPAPCSNTLTLSYNIPSGAAIGSVKILTQGATGLDFQAQPNDTSTTLCTAPIYGSVNANAATCTVDVTFAPLYPGQRVGAVQLYDANNNLLVSTPLYGVGVGPQLAFTPTSFATLATGLSSGPYGVAVDSSGNVYVADTYNGNVDELLAVNGVVPANPTVKVLGSGFSDPEGVAVDGSGNVYVADQGAGQVYEILAVNGTIPASNPTILTLGSGIYAPQGVAVDASGNVYVSAAGNAAIKEILAVNGRIPANPTIKVLTTTYGAPFGIAVDAGGNVYFTESQNDDIEEILAVNGVIPANPTINTLASGLNNPIGLAVDPAGDVYVADAFNQQVKEILAVNGSIPANNPTTVVVGSAAGTGLSLFVPYGLALDARGNLYVGDSFNQQVEEFGVSAPPSLAFASTNVGATSTDSPQSVVIQNIGNATLTASSLVLSDTTDFSQIAGSGTPTDCASSFSLASAAQCNLSLEFNPQSPGPLSATLTLTDNNLNASGATQAIALSGTGTGIAPNPPLAQLSTSKVNFGAVAYPGGTATQNITVTNIGGRTLTVSPSSNGASVLITNNTCASGVAASATCSFTLEFKPTSLGTHGNTITVATNGATNPIIRTTGIGGSIAISTTSLAFGSVTRGNTKTLPITFTDNDYPGTVTIGYTTGSSSFKVTSNGCAAGVTSGNTCTVQVKFAPVSQGSKTASITFTPSVGPSFKVDLTGTLTP